MRGLDDVALGVAGHALYSSLPPTYLPTSIRAQRHGGGMEGGPAQTGSLGIGQVCPLCGRRAPTRQGPRGRVAFGVAGGPPPSSPGAAPK
jgi:hypothetical protein